MTTLKICRTYLNNATLGFVEFGDFRCVSLELPWLANQKDVSCIPGGIGQSVIQYRCCKINSENFGECFAIINVPGRTLIRGHIGNFTRDILGCIVFGDGIKDIDHDGILDVTNSKHTFFKLLSILPDEFNLEIR